MRTAKNWTLHGRGPGIARGCNVPGGLQEKSLESAPLVNPCSNIAQHDLIEVLEGGYGHNIGLRCVTDVPPGAFPRWPTHDASSVAAPEGQKPEQLEMCLKVLLPP